MENNINLKWQKPNIKILGSANDLIKELDPVFDAKNILVNEDEFNTSVQS